MRIAVLGIVLMLAGLLACGESAPPPTPTPVPRVTPDQLFRERDENASRFDLKYKDKWVTITGTVTKIDGGEVHLGVDGWFTTLALHDMTPQEQASADKGQSFTATCKVGSFIIVQMNLRDCKKR